jgi:prefoldin alpha subunit
MSQQQVQLTDLSAQQLSDVKRQLDEVGPGVFPSFSPFYPSRELIDHRGRNQEIEHLTTSFTSLKQAQSKYRGCLNDITQVDETTKGELV